MKLFKVILKTLGHVAVGGATAALLSEAPALIPTFISNPVIGAVVGSALSSVVSAFVKPPNQ